MILNREQGILRVNRLVTIFVHRDLFTAIRYGPAIDLTQLYGTISRHEVREFFFHSMDYSVFTLRKTSLFKLRFLRVNRLYHEEKSGMNMDIFNLPRKTS